MLVLEPLGLYIVSFNEFQQNHNYGILNLLGLWTGL